MIRKKMKSKTEALYEYFCRTKRITGLQALTLFGIYRLSSVILRWRQQGAEIDTTYKEAGDGVRYAEYRLVKPLPPPSL